MHDTDPILLEDERPGPARRRNALRPARTGPPGISSSNQVSDDASDSARRKSHRSSIFISQREQTIIICNKKNGFSTLNACLDEDRFSRRIKNGLVLRRFLHKTGRNYRKILIKRDPFSRIFSFYSDWLVNHDENHVTQSGKRNVHYKNLKKVMSAAAYEEFCHSRNHAGPDRFYAFMKHLKQFFFMDPHTHPQGWLYKSAGLTIDDFDHVIDTRHLSSQLSDTLGIEIGHRRKSRTEKTRQPDRSDERLLQLCSEIYATDYHDLDYPLPGTGGHDSRWQRKYFYFHLAKLCTARHTRKSFFSRQKE